MSNEKRSPAERGASAADSSDRDAYWAEVWADPEIAPVILQHGRIFALTQRNFEATLDRTFGSLAGRTVLDFGCGDGRLLSRLTCGERILFEPSPVYSAALVELAESAATPHAVRIATALEGVAPASVDLAIFHGVAHYMDRDELGGALTEIFRLLTGDCLGIILADLPHPNRFLDLLGALSAHPTTIPEIASQVFRLSGSRYSWDRLEKHRLTDLARLADNVGFRLRPIAGRSFNRARRTVLLERPR